MPELSLLGRRVAVTGGRGFLGRYVCESLTARGADVVPLGRRDYDLLLQADVDRLYREVRPSIVVHAAGSVGGIGANVANPGKFLYENALMGLMLLEGGRAHELDRFVLISTTCAYPENAPIPLREKDLWAGPPVGATGPYGMAKRLLHEACLNYRSQYALDCAVLVLTNLYGPEDNFAEESSHVIPAMIRRYLAAATGKDSSITNWGTGRATRDFLYVTDAASGIVRACEVDLDARPINLGSNQETSIHDLALAVQRAVGFEGEVRWDSSKPEGQPRRYFDISRAQQWLNFSPSVDLETGVARTVAWYQQTLSDASG